MKTKLKKILFILKINLILKQVYLNKSIEIFLVMSKNFIQISFKLYLINKTKNYQYSFDIKKSVFFHHFFGFLFPKSIF